MRHGRRMKKFGKDKAGRKALIRNLAKQLFIYGRMVTTVGRGKFLRTVVEPLITRAKKGTLNDIREIYKYIDDRDLVRKIITEVAPLYKDRNGGYMRVLRLENRPGDNAEMAVVELIDYQKVYKKEEPKKADKAKKEAAPAEVKEPKKEKPKKEEKVPKPEEKKEDKKKDKKEDKKEDRKKEEKKKDEHKKEEHKKDDKKKDKK
jgi:large subunit ribosomal protein L17